MLLFRSEEHLKRWLAGRQRGAVLSTRQLSDLASAWWGDRLASHWKPHTREQNQRILNDLGLTSPFWNLGS
ncbi:MAG TPA: hypothetical protein VJ930_03060 [Acidimicrobiia bacterium]|nr:hypothetical protein [Acidimicrobiia bacterium]